MLKNILQPGLLDQVFHPTWTSLSPASFGLEGEGVEYSTARMWALVLASRHIPYRIHQVKSSAGGLYQVQVQTWFLGRAVNEVQLYLLENDPGSQQISLPDLRPQSGAEPTIGVMVALVVFFWLYSRTYPDLGLYSAKWVARGSAHAGEILNGAWWRTLTALTLHGDGAHVLGNALIGGVFVWLVSRRLGAGLAWALTIASGAVGNILNSLILGVTHNAIGFSTASFGAAGILAGIAPFRIGGGAHDWGDGPFPARIWRFVVAALVPVGAGLGLLAMLGAGEKTDLGAHFWGFISGLVLGVVVGSGGTRHGLPSRNVDRLIFLVTLVSLIGAWVIGWLA